MDKWNPGVERVIANRPDTLSFIMFSQYADSKQTDRQTQAITMLCLEAFSYVVSMFVVCFFDLTQSGWSASRCVMVLF